jgi:HisJ family histidinol phosphate phosphatase
MEEQELDPRLDAIPDVHGHAKGEHKPFAEERPIPYTARMLFLWFFHACRRGSPRVMKVADHVNYLTFEDPAAVNLVRRAIKLAHAGDLYGAAETAGVDVAHAAVVSEGLRKGMRYSIGAEVDNDPRNRPDMQNIVDAMRPDAIIRSIHFLTVDHEALGTGYQWAFDNPEFKHVYDLLGTEKVWELYMAALLEAIEKLPAHIIGHFYVPAKFGHWPDDATLERYEDQLIEACAERGLAVELNARTFYRSFGETPEDEDAQRRRYFAANMRLLQKAKDRGVQIAVGSDAHSPRDQGNGFDAVLEMLDALDINEIAFPINGRILRVALRATEELLRPPEPEPEPVRVPLVPMDDADDEDDEDGDESAAEPAAAQANAAAEPSLEIAQGETPGASAAKPAKARPKRPSRAKKAIEAAAGAGSPAFEPTTVVEAVVVEAVVVEAVVEEVIVEAEVVAADASSIVPSAEAQPATIAPPKPARVRKPKAAKTAASAASSSASTHESAAAATDVVHEPKPEALGKAKPKAAAAKVAPAKPAPAKPAPAKPASTKPAPPRTKAAPAPPPPAKAAAPKAATAKPAAKKTPVKPAAKAAPKAAAKGKPVAKKAAPKKAAAKRPPAKPAKAPAKKSSAKAPARKAAAKAPARKPAAKKTAPKRPAAKAVKRSAPAKHAPPKKSASKKKSSKPRR